MLDLLVVIVVAAVVVAMIIALRPDDFRISRTAVIDATPSAVFPHVNSLSSWTPWSPWAKMDPVTVYTYQGPSEGAGSSMHWVGNSKVGVGAMTITESRSPDRIQIRLDFVKPFAATYTTEFTFAVDGSKTLVTWTMWGTYGWLSKAVGLFMNINKMVGGQFEDGLRALKSVVEKPGSRSSINE